MDILPNEILQQIILKCDNVKNLSIVNKQFNVICSDSYLWYKLIEQHYVKLPNYTAERNYRNVYYDIQRIRILNHNRSAIELHGTAIWPNTLKSICIDTFYYWMTHICTIYPNIADTLTYYYFAIPDDPEKFRIFLNFSKRFLSIHEYKELLTHKISSETKLYYVKNAIVVQMILDEIDDKNSYCLSLDLFGETVLFERRSICKIKVLLGNVNAPNEYCLMTNNRGATALEAFKIILSYVNDKDAYCKMQNNKGQTILHFLASDLRGSTIKDQMETIMKYIIDNIIDLDSVCEMKIQGRRRLVHYLKYDIKVYKFRYNLINNNFISCEDYDIFPQECSAKQLDTYIGEKTYIKSVDEYKNLYIIHISDILYYVLRRLNDINLHLNVKPILICLCEQRKFNCVCGKKTLYFTFDSCSTIIKSL